MDLASESCVACGQALKPAKGRCRACRAWQPSAAWDRALYYGGAALTAVVMAVRWWLRSTEAEPVAFGELWRAWLHPFVLVPLALTLVYGVRVLRRM